jgi:hypothetical protein
MEEVGICVSKASHVSSQMSAGMQRCDGPQKIVLSSSRQSGRPKKFLRPNGSLDFEVRPVRVIHYFCFWRPGRAGNTYDLAGAGTVSLMTVRPDTVTTCLLIGRCIRKMAAINAILLSLQIPP